MFCQSSIMKNYLVLTVLYNLELSDSDFIKNIQGLRYSNLKLLIWDNSPEAKSDLSFCQGIDYEYRHTPENLPLSVIYNRCIDEYSRDYDFFWIFDDDSVLTDNMIEKFNISIKMNPSVKLFLPKVTQNSQIVSPGKFRFFKGDYFQHDVLGVMKSQNIIAIMSGTCIKFSFFAQHKYRFDESLKLYGIDTKFYLDYASLESDLCVVDIYMEHNLSFYTEKDRNVILKKFLDHKNSLRKVIGSKSATQSLLLEAYLLYLSLKNVIKFRSFKFLS